MGIYEAEFELEAITPIFMRGADQRKAEIRAALFFVPFEKYHVVRLD